MVLKRQSCPWPTSELPGSTVHGHEQGHRALAASGCWEEDGIELMMPGHGKMEHSYLTSQELS